jgi:hypothetical protein
LFETEIKTKTESKEEICIIRKVVDWLDKLIIFAASFMTVDAVIPLPGGVFYYVQCF